MATGAKNTKGDVGGAEEEGGEIGREEGGSKRKEERRGRGPHDRGGENPEPTLPVCKSLRLVVCFCTCQKETCMIVCMILAMQEG